MRTEAGIYTSERFADQLVGDVFSNGIFMQFNLGGRGHEASTVYNLSVPFLDWDYRTQSYRTLIMGRHESLGSETDSEVLFFDYMSGNLVTDAPVFAFAQDPYHMGRFKDKKGEQWNVIGNVHIEVSKDDKVTSWHDEWYRYKHSVMELGTHPEPWMRGVRKWKDTRGNQLEDSIFVMPRPQGIDFGEDGKIGFFETENMDTLIEDLFLYAENKDPDTLIHSVTPKGHWSAAGQLRATPDGKTIHVVGHEGERDADELKHYQSTYFQFDRKTRLAGATIVLATADDFPYVEPKPGHNLGKVFFPAGLVSCDVNPGYSWIMGGLGDRQAGRRLIRNPTLRNL